MAATCRWPLITLLMPLQTCSCCPLYVVKAFAYLFAVFRAYWRRRICTPCASFALWIFYIDSFFLYLHILWLVASRLQRRHVWDIAMLLLQRLSVSALAQRSMYLQARYCMLIQINQQPNQCHQTWWRSSRKKPSRMLLRPQAVLRAADALIATFA